MGVRVLDIDPGDKRKTALFIKGTELGDVISIIPGGKNRAGVVYNGVGLGFFTFSFFTGVGEKDFFSCFAFRVEVLHSFNAGFQQIEDGGGAG